MSDENTPQAATAAAENEAGRPAPPVMKRSALVSVKNFFTRRRRRTYAAERVLLLLPRCLQWSKCKQRIFNDDFTECRRCGNCKIKTMLELAEEYGVQPFIAQGGRIAAERARSDDVDAIVAVACADELKAGVKAVLFKPVLAVYNKWVVAKCTDTDVDVDKVREAIEFFVK